MKVRARSMGQYKGRMYQRGEVFEIDDGMIKVQKINPNGAPAFDGNGDPVISHEKSHLAKWMQQIEQSNEGKK